MNFSFTQALLQLGPDAAFKLINAARPPANYLFSQILPERLSNDYDVKSGSLTVRATMAGLVGMDSPYPEGGTIAVGTFLEQSAKLAISLDLPEFALRQLQALVARLQFGGGDVPQVLAREVLNFTDKLLVQSHLDAAEWMRGQALSTGALNWTFNNKALVVDYGVPSANKLTNRTGNDGYGGSTSKFWTDIKEARRLLRGNVRAFIAHPNMIDAIVYNSVNSLLVVNQSNSAVTVQRFTGTTERPSTDARDTVTLISYGLEGEVLDLATPGATVVKPFMPDTKIVAVGNNAGTQYVVGAGSNPPQDNVLGYTHVAPTVEGGGQPGRWARVFTPENRPWALRGESAANLLPVIEAFDKLVILSSALP